MDAHLVLKLINMASDVRWLEMSADTSLSILDRKMLRALYSTAQDLSVVPVVGKEYIDVSEQLTAQSLSDNSVTQEQTLPNTMVDEELLSDWLRVSDPESGSFNEAIWESGLWALEHVPELFEQLHFAAIAATRMEKLADAMEEIIDQTDIAPFDARELARNSLRVRPDYSDEVTPEQLAALKRYVGVERLLRTSTKISD